MCLHAGLVALGRRPSANLIQNDQCVMLCLVARVQADDVFFFVCVIKLCRALYILFLACIYLRLTLDMDFHNKGSPIILEC